MPHLRLVVTVGAAMFYDLDEFREAIPALDPQNRLE
jgi:hypothetical protein